MKVVCILSGGMDSTTLLWDLVKEGHTVEAVSFFYGQRHAGELQSALWQCKKLGVDHRVVDLKSVFSLLSPGSALLDNDVDVPHGHYAAESMKATVVPNRNMIFLSAAIGRAVALKYDAVAYGAHAGDHTIYPDCRPTFAYLMKAAASICDWHSVKVHTPYLYWGKHDIVARGHALGVPYEKTWSCYEGNVIHCGKCGTCVERMEAFELAGVRDPTTYQSVYEEQTGRPASSAPPAERKCSPTISKPQRPAPSTRS